MVTVKGLQTSLGEFGFIKKGDIIQMSKRRADMMIAKNLVELVSDEDDGQEEPTREIKGGIRIKDHRGNTTYVDELKQQKQEKPVKIGAEPLPAEDAGKKMPESYAGKVVQTEFGTAIMGQPGPELVKFPEGAVMGGPESDKVGPDLVELPKVDEAEKAEPAKPEQAETSKAEPKETKKKEYK